MTIYEKLQTIRVELQKKDLKKSGFNSYSNYYYYDLGDFLPEINELCLEYKICPIISFKEDENNNITLTLFNSEDINEKIIFYSNNRKAIMRGAQDIQNLGAEQTYQRRYLYMTAFEIVENDILDTMDKDNQQQTNQNDLEREAQRKRIYAMSKSLNMSEENLKEYIFSMTKKKSAKALTFEENQCLLKDLGKKMADKKSQQKEGD